VNVGFTTTSAGRSSVDWGFTRRDGTSEVRSWTAIFGIEQELAPTQRTSAPGRIAVLFSFARGSAPGDRILVYSCDFLRVS
jgi:hypothetical protein